MKSREGGELYVTRFGLSLLEQLQPENWLDQPWFRENRERLAGTSTVYRVSTKPVAGRSIDLVVKYSRVGEDVPLDTKTIERFYDAEFNTPYEEFSRVMELRECRSARLVRMHRPLAIYVPPQPIELWESGRSKSRIARKKAKYRDVELDIYRQYILVYEWIKGLSATEMLEEMFPDKESYDAELKRLTELSLHALEERGFMVLDHKPAHVILRRRRDGSLLRDKSGELAYALVDFELLVRTPEYEAEIQTTRRGDFFWHEGHRFNPPRSAPLPSHLRMTKVLGVDYVLGHAESTGGLVWVAGRDPNLFDYYLPERWRHTPSSSLSGRRQAFSTVSKDDVHMIWEVSSVGEAVAETDEGKNPASGISYNSPFESFAIALEMTRQGFSCATPCAIYMTGLESPRPDDYVFDESRYESHRNLTTPDGEPVLRPGHNYLTVWGLWNFPDPAMRRKKGYRFQVLDLRQAQEQGLCGKREVDDRVEELRAELEDKGFVAPALDASHLLVCILPDGDVLRKRDGSTRMTIGNFELIHPRRGGCGPA
jgi:hypothetical protein